MSNYEHKSIWHEWYPLLVRQPRSDLVHAMPETQRLREHRVILKVAVPGILLENEPLVTLRVRVLS